jgi:hypothetical protein
VLTERPAVDLMRLHELLDLAESPMLATLEARLDALVQAHLALCRRAEARARLTDRDRLLAGLDEDPCDLLLMLHECALDAGEEAEAKGWGWLHARRRWPARYGGGWGWTVRGVSGVDYPHTLPPSLGRKAHAGRGTFPSCRAALEAVVGVIARDEWSLDAKEDAHAP